MNASRKIEGAMPENGIEKLEGFYEIIKNNAILYIVRTGKDLPSHIAVFNCTEVASGVACTFINCRWLGWGNDLDKFMATAAWLGESGETYNKNSYRAAIFHFSKRLLPFFELPFEIGDDTNGNRILKFKSPGKRTMEIEINPGTVLSIQSGYTQSYSALRYKATASVAFRINFIQPVSREACFNFIDAIRDFFSLVSYKKLETKSISLQSSSDFKIIYFGEKLQREKNKLSPGNNLIEISDIGQRFSQIVSKWTAGYESNKIAIGLFRDAEMLSDEQLKFICYARCLEVFHGAHFASHVKDVKTYQEELYKFLIEKNLTDVTLKNFLFKKELTYSHKIYDLIRFAWEYLSDQRYWMVLGIFKRLNAGQKITETRNHYIHLSGKAADKAFGISDLPILNLQLSVFIRVLFLKTYQFDEKAIGQTIHSLKGYYF